MSAEMHSSTVRRGNSGAKPPPEPKDAIRHLIEPAISAVIYRTEMLLEEASRAATNLTLEQAAQIAERFVIEEDKRAPSQIRDRVQRQNKVAREIALCIRSEISSP